MEIDDLRTKIHDLANRVMMAEAGTVVEWTSEPPKPTDDDQLYWIKSDVHTSCPIIIRAGASIVEMRVLWVNIGMTMGEGFQRSIEPMEVPE